MADSILGQILIEFRDAIRDDITLTGVEREHILIQPVPTDSESAPVSLPFITISSYLAESFPNPGSNVGDDYGYPVSVFIVDQKTAVQKNFDSLDRRFVWREAILDHFIRSKVTIAASGTVQYDITIDPSPIVDLSAWFASPNLFISAMNFRAKTRVTRRT